MEVVELNAFEEAVVSSIMVKYVQKTLEVQILELGKNETQEAVEKIKRDQRAELEAGLPPEKFEAIMTLQEEGFRKAKKKKKKKKKKKDS